MGEGNPEEGRLEERLAAAHEKLDDQNPAPQEAGEEPELSHEEIGQQLSAWLADDEGRQALLLLGRVHGNVEFVRRFDPSDDPNREVAVAYYIDGDGPKVSRQEVTKSTLDTVGKPTVSEVSVEELVREAKYPQTMITYLQETVGRIADSEAGS